MSQKRLMTAMFLSSLDERLLLNTTALPNTAVNSSGYISKLSVVMSSQIGTLVIVFIFCFIN